MYVKNIKMITAVGAVLALAAACGPKGGGVTGADGKGKGTGTGPKGAGTGAGATGPKIETHADGTVDVVSAKTVDVSDATKEAFMKVKASYEDAKKAGTLKAKCDSIAGDFKELTEKDPTFLAGAFNYAAIELECGNESVAETAFRDMVKRYPDYGRAYGGIGSLLYKHGKESEARDWITKCLEKDPTVVECNLDMASMLFDDYEKTKSADVLKDAVKRIRTALAVDASSMAAYALFAYVYYTLGQYRLAGLVCQQAKKYDDSYAPIYNVLGLIELANKNVTAALAHFKTAVAKDPDYVPGLINWGAITINYRDYDTAIDKFERALKIGGDDYDVWITLGVAYRGKATAIAEPTSPERRGWLKKAEDAYTKASSMRKDEAGPYYNLGLLWENYKYTDDEKKNLSTAISMYDKFLSMIPKDAKSMEKLKKDAERRKKGATDLLKVLSTP